MKITCPLIRIPEVQGPAKSAPQGLVGSASHVITWRKGLWDVGMLWNQCIIAHLLCSLKHISFKKHIYVLLKQTFCKPSRFLTSSYSQLNENL